MHVFFTPDTATELIQLSEEESRHCSRVLRLGVGHEVIVTDGQGSWIHAVIDVIDNHKVMLRTIRKEDFFGKRPFHLHMAVAPTKSMERFEWFLEKATECGIDEISPIICEKSERRIVKPGRMEKILVSAMKQSMRAYLPKLNQAVDLQTFLERPVQNNAYIAHCSMSGKTNLAKEYKAGSDILIMVGPEGDFTDVEIDAAISKGFHPISLGTERLRTETAAITLCIQANTMNGLLQ